MATTATRPAPADLKAIFGLPPERAIAYLEGKGYAITWDWHEMLDRAHDTAFTVAKAMRLDLLSDIRAALEQAVHNGETLKTFIENLQPVLEVQGWWGKQVIVDGAGNAERVQLGSPRRLKTIYQTNLQSAYMAGRLAEMQDTADTHPYWQYTAILDGRTRPSHRALDGKIYRHDDPVWSAIYPPNGFNCRCRVTALSESAVKRAKLKPDSSDGKTSTETVEAGVNKRTGEIRTAEVTLLGVTGPNGAPLTFRTDPGFNHAPGSGLADSYLKKRTTVSQWAPSVAAEWPLFGAEADLETFAALGTERYNAVFGNWALPDDSALHVALRGLPLDKALTEMSDVDFLRIAPTLQKHLVTELGKVRSLGRVAPDVDGSSRAVKMIKTAAAYYPDDWVKAANALGPLHARYSQARGWHVTVDRDGLFRIPVFGPRHVVQGEGFILSDSSSTAIHEYAHRLQAAMPRLDALFQAEHKRRTAGDPLRRLRDIAGPWYDAKEVAREDGYYTPYMGKEYDNRGALEVMTMSLQPLLGAGSDEYAARMLYDLLRKDRRMAETALGLLFHFR